MPKKLADAATGAWTVTFELRSWELPAALIVPDLTGSDTVALNVMNHDGSYDPVERNGSAVVMTANHSHEPMFEPGRYQIVKGTTTAAVPASLATPDIP